MRTEQKFLDDLGRTWTFERQAGGGMFVSVADDDVLASTTFDSEGWAGATGGAVECPTCLKVYEGPDAAEQAMECALVYQDA